MRNPVYVRNFESTIRLLHARGHSVHVAFEQAKEGDTHQRELIDELVDDCERVTRGAAPTPRDDWFVFATALRLTRDYLRYLEPRYRDADKLRERAARPVDPLVPRVAAMPLLRTRPGQAMLGSALRHVEAATPTSPAVEEFVAGQHPDLVLVTPLVGFGSPQVDVVRAAQRRRIPAGVCVFSWDNLTNKGLMHVVPDLVIVWNESQRQEAVELHGIPVSHVSVTGAAAYDHWFAWQPSTSRQEFCQRAGLPDDRPFLLYLCSSAFIAPQEVDFVRRWVRDVRRLGNDDLSNIAAVVRPHPMNRTEWEREGLSELDAVTVFPPAGADPRDDLSRADYYDSIYHSAAVVGINTTALIESAIVGRSVLTLRDPQFQGTQEGTLHFRHLLQAGGGLLRVADTTAEHVAQLQAAVSDPGVDVERARRFVESFLRPGGIESPAAPNMVASLEAAAAAGVRSPSQPLAHRPLRFALAPVARRVARYQRERAARRKRATRAGDEAESRRLTSVGR